MAGKRTATSDLNHDNWDQEVEREEAGIFNKASEDVLKKRVFKTAKRRMIKTDEGTSNVFSQANLVKFTSNSLQGNNQIFGFLSKIQPSVSCTNGSEQAAADKSDNNTTAVPLNTFVSRNKSLEQTSNATEDSTIKNVNKCDEKTNESLFCFGNKKEKSLNKCENNTPYPIFNFENQKGNIVLENLTQNLSNSSADLGNSLNDYYSKLKGLNQSVANWINKHVDSNPLINLQPIFKDYEKFFDEIEKERDKLIKNDFEKDKSTGSSLKPSNTIIENSKKSLPGLGYTQGTCENRIGMPGSTEGNSVNSSIPKFSFGSNNMTFGTSSFGMMSNKPVNFGTITPTVNNDDKKEEELSDEPPKLDVKQVEEEGHIYSIRCKLFIKKDGNFVEKGIGSLYLKPVEESDKIQVIVRAHNSLGNVLSNFILSKSIPIQRMGKNNIMIICIPTPESQPPPVPVLIKVKTEQDADDLLKTLEDHKK